MKTFKMNMLAASVATTMLMSLTAHASEKKIGDLSIYQAPTQGSPTLTMMLDTSGSMKDIDIPTGRSNCYTGWQRLGVVKYSYTNPKNSAEVFNIDVPVDGCWTDYNRNGYHFDRLSLLKTSLIELLTATGSAGISSDNKVAVGNFSADGEGRAGKIMIPAKPLDFAQRKQIVEYVKDLTAQGGTPTANALAEASAYMMGTTTLPEGNWSVIGRKSGSYYQPCFRYDTSVSSGTLTMSDGTRISSYVNCDAYNSQVASMSNLPAGYKTYYGSATYYFAKTTNSGFEKSAKATKNAAQTAYQAGAAEAQCAGNGIYLLTDGKPELSNGTGYNYAANAVAKTLMNNALAGTQTLNTCSGLQGENYQGWECMASFSKLINSKNNPAGIPIKLATAGLGTAFAGLPTITTKNEKNEDVITYNCEGGTTANLDTRNLCKLGEKGYGFGEGGFTHLTSSEDIKGSIKKFLEGLTETIDTAPSGTITIPTDPLSSTNLQPFAYLPMLEPKVAGDGSTNVIWAGNVKKYNVNQGTLFGQNDSRLYVSPVTGDFPFQLNKATKDLWMGNDANFLDNKGNVANNAIRAGGVYARLTTPNATTPYSVRNVWVEDVNAAGAPRLVKVGVDASGNLVGFADLLDPIYTPVVQAYLLNFLGYSSVSVNEADYAGLTKPQALAKLKAQLTPITSPTKVLGGVVHSKPALVSYGGRFNAEDKDTINNETGAAGGDGVIDEDAGQISNNEADREDFIMFGSMDGALHLVEADSGEESVAVIPKVMLQRQLKALKSGATGTKTGAPEFGVDAPWVSKAEYQVNLNGNGSIDATSVRAYGGLRMGGTGFYGIDFENAAAPEILFSIQQGQNKDGVTTDEFLRLGQTWSEPLVANIKTGPNADDKREVVIFAGGYDMCYESPTFTLKASGAERTDDCNNKRMAYGNAVYMVDAATGERLWTWSGAPDTFSAPRNNTVETAMTHSVVGGITGLDRNDNGTLDHLYFADLGGQVFRIDLQEGVPVAQMTERVVEVFDANEGINIAGHIPFRFYAKPIVSFYDNPAGERFATISIASGDRSSPLSKNRTVADANRVYGIFDRDVAQQALYGNINLISQNLDSSDLTRLPFTGTDRNATITPMQTPTFDATLGRNTYASQGWYYPLDRFDGYGNAKDVKSMGDGMVIGGFYYMTAYNPNMNYGEADSCSAKITGGSERQLYCMPYGICTQTAKDDPTQFLSANGTGGYTRAGAGIQELALGPLSANQRSSRALLGTQTLSELVATDNRNNVGEGSVTSINGLLVQKDAAGNPVNYDKTKGDGSAALPVFTEGYTLVTKRWYQLENNTNN